MSSFNPEPAFRHGQPESTAVIFCNLGTPEQPTAPAVRRFLGEFLSDRRVVEIPRWVWMIILHGIILRLRPQKSAAKYAAIWDKEGSPLRLWTRKQALLLHGRLGQRGHRLTAVHAMRYGAESIGDCLDQLKAKGATRVLILPAYPQYSATTTGSVFDAVYTWASKTRNIPEFRFINRYGDHPGYIKALGASVRKHWLAQGKSTPLVMSFHGVPERTLDLGDPYHCECMKTARLLGQELGLAKEQYKVTFQSRLGRAKWLEPYTEPSLIAMAHAGLERVDVICPGFNCEGLETLEEINMEARQAFLAAGGKTFHYIPCLNDNNDWINALSDIAVHHLQGWPTLQTADAQLQDAQRQRALAMGATQ